MVAYDLVVDDLIVRVLGTREQVDPSTKLAGHGLCAIIQDPVVPYDVVAAAARDHETVVTVVPENVFENLRAAGSEEHDAFEE
ncbi:MAG: hypothetical protein M3Q85_17090, partial [Acidobacteriota bacterium]|nr:hypothetical protein [Acidobacteriota bacterium]